LIGLWHGANWTFLLFGLYWGFVIALYLYVKERVALAAAPQRPSGVSGILGQILSTVFMFAIVCVGWVFFRAESLSQAWAILTRVLSQVGEPTVLRPEVLAAPILWTLVGGLWLVEWISGNRPRIAATMIQSEMPRMILRHAMIVGILFSFVSQRGEARPFIYFQF
jgi:alginate O-acetyltransferase complex protein AlgI